MAFWEVKELEESGYRFETIRELQDERMRRCGRTEFYLDLVKDRRINTNDNVSLKNRLDFSIGKRLLSGKTVCVSENSMDHTLHLFFVSAGAAFRVQRKASDGEAFRMQGRL